MNEWRQLSFFSSMDFAVDPENPDRVKDGYYSLHMRRYLGCKTRLLPRIAEVVEECCPDVERVFDIFAGTGVVGHLFNTPERRIVVNDFLPSNHAILWSWFNAGEEDAHQIEDTISYLQDIRIAYRDYYCENYGGRFFQKETACRIGAIRDEIDQLNLRPEVRYSAIASLLYAADSVALTCGHFDAYRGLKDRPRPFVLRFPAIPYRANKHNKVFCEDANELVARIHTDLLYIDRILLEQQIFQNG